MTTEIQKYEGVLQAVQKEESLIESFLPMIPKLFIFAPEEIQSWKEERKEQFLRKTMMKIAHDEKMKPCFESNEGKMSLLTAVEKACSTGLEIGGKHAYLIPQPRYIKIQNQPDVKVTEARFSIKASGYYAILAGGERPIFKDLRWSLVYEKDECKPNCGTGEVEHIPFIGEDRGKLLGCWVQIVKKNGQKDLKYFTMHKINQWKSFSKQQGGAWSKWPDEMTEQACIRHACDKYEQARDLLVSALYDGVQPDSEETNTSIIDEALSEEPVIEPEEKIDNQEESDDNF